MPKSIAITCTRPRCDTIVMDLQTAGIQATAHPVLNITPISTPKPDINFDAVLVSSIHAISDGLPRTSFYIAVGEHTALRLTECGYIVTQIGTGGLRDMDLRGYSSLLYPCASTPSYIPNNAKPWPVYKSDVNTDLSWINNYDAIAVFSRAAACAMAEHIPPNVRLICLSQTIADTFNAHPPAMLAVCSKPHYDDMKFLIQSLTRT